jgi:hypothetical protein
MRREEGVRDALLKEMPTRSVCAEIGVYKGDFAERIMRIVRPRELHLIDPWTYETSADYRESWYGGEQGISQAHMDTIYQGVLQKFEMQIAAGTIRIHRTRSEEASHRFSNEYFDWVYVDGNHLYEFVRSDLQHYWPKVKNGGYIAGDDYMEGCWWQGGVKKAVDEFTTGGLRELLRIRDGQFWIRKN